MERLVDFAVTGILIVAASTASYFAAVRKCESNIDRNRLVVKTVDVEKVMENIQNVCKNSPDVKNCIKNQLQKYDEKLKRFDDGKTLMLIDKVVLFGGKNITDKMLK